MHLLGVILRLVKHIDLMLCKIFVFFWLSIQTGRYTCQNLQLITDQPHYSLILERHVSKYEYLTELIYLRKTCE